MDASFVAQRVIDDPATTTYASSSALTPDFYAHVQI